MCGFALQVGRCHDHEARSQDMSRRQTRRPQLILNLTEYQSRDEGHVNEGNGDEKQGLPAALSALRRVEATATVAAAERGKSASNCVRPS